MEIKKILQKIDDWDKKIILKYNGIGGNSLTNFLKIISFSGRESIWMFLMVYFLFIFYDPMIFSFISSIFLLGVLIIAPIKKYANRNRPFESLEDMFSRFSTIACLFLAVLERRRWSMLQLIPIR